MARKQNLEATIESNRPLTSAGRLVQRLAGLALALRGVVTKTQKSFIYPACQRDNDALDELAIVLVKVYRRHSCRYRSLAGIGKLPEPILRHAVTTFPSGGRAARGKV